MISVGINAILRIDLPDYTVRLCDGGFISFAGEIYQSVDPVFGSLSSVQGMSEGIGEEVPALELTMLPPSGTAASILTSSGYQNSIVRTWLAEFDLSTGIIVGNPTLMFHGQIDQVATITGKSRKEIAITVVSTAEKLFMQNDGNSLTPRWHKSIWPAEKGHDNAVGLTVPIAWGVESRPTAGSGASGSMSPWSAMINAIKQKASN